MSGVILVLDHIDHEPFTSYIGTTMSKKEYPQTLIVKTLDEATAKEVAEAYEAFQDTYWHDLAVSQQKLDPRELAEQLKTNERLPKPNKHDWVLEIFMIGWNRHKKLSKLSE